MLGSIPLAAGLALLVLLLLVAYALMPARQKQSIASAVAAPLQSVSQSYLSQRERDILEDGAMIAASYEQTARDELRQAALDRHREQLVRQQSQQSAMANMMAQFGVAGANASASRKSTS